MTDIVRVYGPGGCIVEDTGTLHSLALVLVVCGSAELVICSARTLKVWQQVYCSSPLLPLFPSFSTSPFLPPPFSPARRLEQWEHADREWSRYGEIRRSYSAEWPLPPTRPPPHTRSCLRIPLCRDIFVIVTYLYIILQDEPVSSKQLT